MSKRIKFIFNPSEIAAGTRGASLGPEAIRVAARNSDSKIFNTIETVVLNDFNASLDSESQYIYAKYINVLVEVYNTVSKVVSESLSLGEFPILLAADHASAGGTIAGIKQAYPGKRLGVVWIDAHGDLHSPYTTPSGNMHGMPLTIVLNEDNLPSQINIPDALTIQYWEALKNVGM